MRYRLEIKGVKSSLLLDYTEGLLRTFELVDEGDLRFDQRCFIWDSLVAHLKDFEIAKAFVSGGTKFKLTQVPTDLSFEGFWNRYNNKVGKKERVAKIWSMMGESDQIAALMGIQRYKRWQIQNASVQVLYPETYLNQRRWENEY